MNIGGPEMILIFLVVLLLFGGKKLPELARGLGKGLREFKDASDGIKREIHNNINSVNEVADQVKSEVQSAADYVDTETSAVTGYPSPDEAVLEHGYASQTELDQENSTPVAGYEPENNTADAGSEIQTNPDETGLEHTKIAH
ncbi:twin-arginine translocase TatA/TatE family subunit [Daejeonella sp.]|uniref:twin-arginine translocase TatA/TatE family subunit n=1 Tax=Daejeonella sp. TaxID=2805397 RepID=UPI0027276C37|nr:twin-arginine translocase TatA/TatE family subunit [Daejeonella sp.]MDO8992920.1 twin-arginine translocase TatA/TatE family subunit [Daejeonella sp.]MDP2413775.1 twin-arginine translocase TatA/TatE family subunit [Daejeonella sp.]